MLRRLSHRLTYANVVSTLALIVAVGGTSAYAANTIRSTDIVDGEVASVDIKNQDIASADVKDQSLTTFDVSTFLGADVVDGSLTGLDIGFDEISRGHLANDSVSRDEIENGRLIDRDVGETVYRDFAGSIGVVNSQSCVDRQVTGGTLSSDHILLTPSIVDSHVALEYSAKYDPGIEQMFVHVCNWTGANINDGITHFNVIAFNGLSAG